MAFTEKFAGSTVALTPLDRMALEQRIGGLRPGWTRGLAEPSTMDIDVAALHAACLRAATKAGAKITKARKLDRKSGAKGKSVAVRVDLGGSGINKKIKE